MLPRSRPLWLCVALATVLFGVPSASSFDGPFATRVDVGSGVMLDVDVRWPSNGLPLPAGWPVIFWAHGAGGNKSSLAGAAENFADKGYVTLTYSNRPAALQLPPEVLASDLVALKAWLVNDFAAAAGVTVPIDPARFGLSGSSLGGYVSWSGALLTDAFATVVPFDWGFHAFLDYFVHDGSIERRGADRFLDQVVGEYPAAALRTLFEDTFGPAAAEFPRVTIPVMNQHAMLDNRTSGTQALRDHRALGGGGHIIYLGTGAHGTPDDDRAFRNGLRDRWFAFHLKGQATGIDREPAIQLALLASNEHVAFPTWPPPEQRHVTLYLQRDGALLPAPPNGIQPDDVLANDPGSLTYADVAPGFDPVFIRSHLAKETLVYETAILEEEVLLVGEPSVELHVASTGSRYQLNVHLYDAQDGQDPILLAYGTSTRDASPATVDVDLTVTARRLPAGHRLRLEITNRDDQDVDPSDGFSPGGGELRYVPFFQPSTTRVFHDDVRPSSLTLPLIGRDTLPVSGPSGSTSTSTTSSSTTSSTSYAATSTTATWPPTTTAPPTSTTSVNSTSTTLAECTNPRCVLDAALAGEACLGERIPRGIRKRIAKAIKALDRAEVARRPARAGRLRNKAGRLLAAAERMAAAAAVERRPRLSPPCAAAITSAIRGLRDWLGA
jgi:hypothetical protein